MKKIPVKYTTKFKYDKENEDIILKNGKRLSEMYGKDNFKLYATLRNLNGIPTEVVSVRTAESAYNLVILGCTGDLVRDEKGEPILFLGNIHNPIRQILEKTDVMEMKRASDKKSNILSPDGTFLLKDWYDDIIYVPDSNLFIVSDNDMFNLAKLGGSVLSDTWYTGIEMVSNKCFPCMDKEMKKYIMNNEGKLMFDGRSFDAMSCLRISLSKDYFGGKPFKGKIVCCVDKDNVILITENLEILDYGRNIIGVNKLSSGIYKVLDDNGNYNIIGDKFNLISENWFTNINFEDDVSSAYINNSDFIIFGSKSLVTLNNGMLFTSYAIEKSDPVKGLFLCVKRKDGKCNIYSVPNLQVPVLSNWAEDIYKTDNGFICAKQGELYSIVMCYHTNKTIPLAIDGKNIFDVARNKYCVQKSDGKFSFGYYESVTGYGPAKDLNGKEYVFDNVYDLDSEYPIVEKDGKFNAFSILTLQLVFNRWYDDIEPIDDNGDFNCLVDGKWTTEKAK